MAEKNTRIAMFGHKRIPSREGGVEIVVEELATRMQAMGLEVTCYNRKGHHVSGYEFDSRKINEFKGVKIKRVFTINKAGLAAVTSSFAAGLRSAFGKYDVVHIHAEGPAAMCWMPKLFRKKVIVTVHGLDWQREKWKQGFASKYIYFGEKMAVKYADSIIVLSKSVQEYFRDKYGRETVYIPNGVNKPVKLESDIIKKQWALSKDDYILYLGRIVPEKGLRYLIKAFKTIKTDKKLVIAGGVSDTSEFYQEMTELALDDDRIIFVGFVQGAALQELYSNAYIYALPSDLEGMPLSLLEAMSYGNCCITSDISECAEVVEDKALTFTKGNVDELAHILQTLCDDPESVQKYKSKAQSFILSKYNWDSVVERTLELY